MYEYLEWRRPKDRSRNTYPKCFEQRDKQMNKRGEEEGEKVIEGKEGQLMLLFIMAGRVGN